MKLNKIVIACFKKDLFLLRTCVASIRYWYPTVEIYLLKDKIQGDFSVREFIQCWNCKVFETEQDVFGWPWSKLAVLLAPQKGKYLFLDSDTVFLGRVLDELDKFEEDFIVTGVKADESDHQINDHYIDMKKVKEFDDQYVYPGFGFNGGQIVMSSCIISKDDLSSVIAFEPRIYNRYPEIFKHGDQGCLNYVLAKGSSLNVFSVRFHDYWIWPGIPAANEIKLDQIKNKTGVPYIMHWAGIKPVDFRQYIRYDIISFYNHIYYSKITFGFIKRMLHYYIQLFIVKAKIIKYRCLNMQYAK